jgi:hypothetical protein
VTIECCTWDKTSVIAGPVGSRFRMSSRILVPSESRQRGDLKVGLQTDISI